MSLLLALALFVGGIVFFVFGIMKSSDVYRVAVHRAKTNVQVADVLGAPISEGLFLTGNINVTPQSGNANLSIPVSGPKHKGTIHVVATKADGEWVCSKMGLRADGTG